MNTQSTTTEKLKPYGSVSHMTMDDLDTLVSMHAQYLNYGEGIRPHFEQALRDPDNINLRYCMDGRVVGIYSYTRGIALSGGHEDICGRIAELTGGVLTYTGDAVVVLREYRRYDISGELYRAMRSELKRRGVVYAVHELWVHPDGHIPAIRLLDAYGSRHFIGHFEGFYANFNHFGYKCPICGEHCVCAADVYVSEI